MDWTAAPYDVQDDSGNDFAGVTDQSVTNNTPASPPASASIPARAMVVGAGTEATDINSDNEPVYIQSY